MLIEFKTVWRNKQSCHHHKIILYLYVSPPTSHSKDKSYLQTEDKPGHCLFRLKCRQHLGAFLTQTLKQTLSFHTTQVSWHTQKLISVNLHHGDWENSLFCWQGKYFSSEPKWEAPESLYRQRRGPHGKGDGIKQFWLHSEVNSTKTRKNHGLFLCNSRHLCEQLMFYARTSWERLGAEQPYFCTYINSWNLHSLLFLLALF